MLLAARELKRPLVDLRQLALAFDGAGESDEQIRDKMVNVSDRAIRQINDLMKLRRLEDGMFVMEPVAVQSVCSEVTRELEYLFRFNNRNLFIKYPRHVQPVVANRELLKSVVYNFMLNAMRYTDEEMESRLVVKTMGERVRILVRDFGPALPMDVWREMRRGFVKKPTSIAMRPGTSGLGLYIASRFSRYMHAQVGAVRHPDGTSFYVELPVSRQMRLF